jgi:hypothetical protein
MFATSRGGCRVKASCLIIRRLPWSCVHLRIRSIEVS